jgi:hypothetical protein
MYLLALEVRSQELIYGRRFAIFGDMFLFHVRLFLRNYTTSCTVPAEALSY